MSNISFACSSFFDFVNLLGKGKVETLVGIGVLETTFFGGIAYLVVVASTFSKLKSLACVESSSNFSFPFDGC